MMYHLPTPRIFLVMEPRTMLQPTRHGHILPPAAEEVIPLYLKLRCSQRLNRAMACANKPTHSSVRRRFRRQAGVSSAVAAGLAGSFVLRVAVETDQEAEPEGSCAVSAARLREGSKTSPALLVLSHDLQVLSPSNLLPIGTYHQGGGTSSPLNLPRLCQDLQTLRRIGERVRAPRPPLSTFTDAKLPSLHKTANRLPVPPLASFRT